MQPIAHVLVYMCVLCCHLLYYLRRRRSCLDLSLLIRPLSIPRISVANLYLQGFVVVSECVCVGGWVCVSLCVCVCVGVCHRKQFTLQTPFTVLPISVNSVFTHSQAKFCGLHTYTHRVESLHISHSQWLRAIYLPASYTSVAPAKR